MSTAAPPDSGAPTALPPPPLPAWLSGWWAPAIVGTLGLLVLLGALGFLAYQRARLQDAADQQTALYARVLEDQANRTFGGAGLVLNAMADNLALQPRPDAATAQALLSQQTLQGLPYLRSVSLVDADGSVLASSNPDNLGQRVPIDRLAQDSAGLTLGPLWPGRDLGDPATGAVAGAGAHWLPLLRPVALPAAKAGQPDEDVWLVAALNPDYFTNQYQLILGQTELHAAMLSYRGQLLAGSLALPQTPGSALSVPALLARLQADDHGLLQGPGLAGAPARSAFRSTALLPVVLVVDLPDSAINAQMADVWRATWLATATLLGLLAALGALAWRSLRSHAAAQQGLQRAMTAAEQANAAKGEFLANISHELRTPLQSILGFSELGMVRAYDGARARAMFGDIHAASQRMLVLVNDLLDLSRLESTVGDIVRQPTELPGLLQAVLDELAPLAEPHGLQLRLTVAEPGQPLRALADPFRLQQVLRNLLANAIRWSPAGGVVELLATGGAAAPPGADPSAGQAWLRLQVLDQGPGIPPGELDSIFQAFVQSSRTKSGAGGTGLGLAISRKIVQAHQGHLSADNRPTGGAVFTLLLPALDGRAADAPAEAAALSTGRS